MKKLLLSVLTIVVFGIGAKAQNVNIPDANFKTFLVGNSAINTGGDPNEIEVSEAAAFTGPMTCSGLSIRDLTGIEEFTALTELQCNNNFLTDLDVSLNVALTWLRCSENFLTSLDLSANTSLNFIKCQNNHLTNLNIANGNNSNITDFDARYNSLTCINIDNPMPNIPANIDASAYLSVNCVGDLMAEIVYVDINATGANDGTSWADAFTNLMHATINANHLSEIWVAAGTYKPSNTGNRFLSFNPIAEMYGGFIGTETQLSQRDWSANPTILSGDVGIIGDETDNSYTVLMPRGSDNIVIDGFTISGGYSSGTISDERYGAAIYILNGVTPVTIRNCIIKNNWATATAGIYCRMPVFGETKNVTIENTHINNNKARWATAFDMQVVDGTLNVNLVNCLVDSNQTLTMFGGNGLTYSCGRFLEYEAGNSGFISNPKLDGKIINCTFVDNLDLGPPTPRALIATQGPTLDLEMYNTIFWNSAGVMVSVSYGTNTQYEPNSVTVYNTISRDVMNTATYVTSTNNTQVDPLFTSPTLMDYTLQSSSPAIDGGSTSGIVPLIPSTDLAGGVRINGTIDLGCYEYCIGTTIDITTTVNNQTITANENSAGSTYQWLDCDNNNAIIVNETTESFTATTNGNYACEITNGCSIDVTACVVVTGVGISENSNQNNIVVYPNPTTSQLTIDTDDKIENVSILDVTGKTIKTVVLKSNTIDVSNLVNGLYFLQVQTKEGMFNSKFIKR